MKAIFYILFAIYLRFMLEDVHELLSEKGFNIVYGASIVSAGVSVLLALFGE